MLVLAFLLIVVLFVWVLALTQRTSKLAYRIEVLSGAVNAAEARSMAATLRDDIRMPATPPAATPAVAAPAAAATAAASPAAPMPAVPADMPPIREAAAPSVLAQILAPTGAAVASTVAPSASAPGTARAARPPAPREPSPLEPVWRLIKGNPFASAGIGMIVLGLGFLLSYLAVQGLLPPWLRIATVAAIGLAMLIIGLRIERKRADIGNHLQGGALAVEYLCVLWAYQGYELLEPLAAFACLATLSAAAFAWSFWKRRALFATVGLLGALLAPVIASTGGGTLAGL
ncbi:hypothetical protein BH10PSE17_BH10PSE17_18390 [soil metagenome]